MPEQDSRPAGNLPDRSMSFRSVERMRKVEDLAEAFAAYVN